MLRTWPPVELVYSWTQIPAVRKTGRGFEWSQERKARKLNYGFKLDINFVFLGQVFHTIYENQDEERERETDQFFPSGEKENLLAKQLFMNVN